MTSFDHFVVTRFNVRVNEHQDVAPDSWLNDRFRLFKLYCWPSMFAQDNSQFTWIIFLDASTPQWLRQSLASLAGSAPFGFELIYTDNVFGPDVIRAAIRELHTEKLVVTTRLDNDDMVATDFISTIQQHVADEKFMLINLVSGSQMSSGLPYRRPYPANPFITLVENVPVPNQKTVFATEHYSMPSMGAVRNIRTGHPMWMQVVHEANLANEVVGLPMLSGRLRQWFPSAPLTDWPFPLFLKSLTVRSLRIIFRLVSKPKRITALVRTMTARRSN